VSVSEYEEKLDHLKRKYEEEHGEIQLKQWKREIKRRKKAERQRMKQEKENKMREIKEKKQREKEENKTQKLEDKKKIKRSGYEAGPSSAGDGAATTVNVTAPL